jgi:hypothetical protein
MLHLVLSLGTYVIVLVVPIGSNFVVAILTSISKNPLVYMEERTKCHKSPVPKQPVESFLSHKEGSGMQNDLDFMTS